MNYLYEIGTIIVSAVIIISLALKLYSVAKKAERSLPAGSSQMQAIEAATEAIVSYLVDNRNFDAELIDEVEKIIEALDALGVNTSAARELTAQYDRLLAERKS